MKILDLITKAKDTSGMSLKDIAATLHVTPSTLTAWKQGSYRPDSTQIIFLAEKAHLPAIETLAEIECETHPEMAHFWKVAVSQLRQNQG